MRFQLRSITVISIIALLTSCSKVPDHSKYIPKDAVVVVSVDARAMGKKIAWDVITGSKLFKKLKSSATDTSLMSNLALSGIDGANTFYLYIKGNQRFNGNRVTALVPLADAGAWESYVKKLFPNISIKQQGNRKEATLTTGMYAGWNDKLLIVMNVLPDMHEHDADDTSAVNPQPAMDATTLAAEMENAFNVTKENRLVDNKHFNHLQAAGHDVGFWVNYDLLMSQYLVSNSTQVMGGFTPPNTLWKDAAFAGGFDFNKGNIKGDLLYYTSDDLNSVAKDLSGGNADKDMVERLPLKDADLVATWHLSPRGIKALLNKMNVLGFANVALARANMTVDYVLDAFTGDMALTLNDFALNKTTNGDSVTGLAMTASYKPAMSAMYVIKINNKDNFNRIMQMAAGDNGVPSIGNNTYAIPLSQTDSIIIKYNDKYAVVTNKYAVMNNFMNGTNKGQALPGNAGSTLTGHPFAAYFDVQQMVKTIDPATIANSPHDSATISEAKNLLSNIMLYGGDYKEDAFEYHVEVNFSNKDENSLLQLMDFGMKVNEHSTLAAGNNKQEKVIAVK